MTKYERKLIEEAIANYIDTLYEKEEFLEEVKDDLHVTQEIDELINDCRLKRQSLSETIYKI